MSPDSGVPQVVHRGQKLPATCRVPVVHAHAAFGRAVSGLDGVAAPSVVLELAVRRLQWEPCDGS